MDGGLYRPGNGVVIQFGRDASGICYELLEPLDENSPVFFALANRKAILNHVAYGIENLVDGANDVVRVGCAPTYSLSRQSRTTAAGFSFCEPLHSVIELIEALEFRHE